MLDAADDLDTTFQKELHQSVVETATPVCANIQDARRQVVANRAKVYQAARAKKLKFAAASTHPFSRWERQDIADGERYQVLIEELQDVARANLIFGLHVHIGIEDVDERIAVFNSARYFLPHVLALSCSSPFFKRRDTGLQSVRSLIFKRMPRTGIPDPYRSHSSYMAMLELLARCSDGDRKKMWWDLLPHGTYPTLEYRICDLPPLVDEVIAIAALFQALTARLMRMHRDNMEWRQYPSALIEENKWRAVRYGTSGKLIDFGRQKEVPVPDLIRELLDFVDEVVDLLGSRKELEYIETMLKQGTSADRQRRVYQETGSFEAVVDHLIEETMRGVPVE